MQQLGGLFNRLDSRKNSKRAPFQISFKDLFLTDSVSLLVPSFKKQQGPTVPSANTAISKNNVQIRLTNERWKHISIGHPEMAEYFDQILDCVENPQIIYFGFESEFLAVKELSNEINKFIVVVYKELDKDDGFVITSFLTNKLNYYKSKQIAWKQQK